MTDLEQLDGRVNQISELAEELRAGVHPNGNEELKAQIREVARARAMYQEAAEAKRAAMAQWEEEHAGLIVKVIMLSKIKEEQEAKLREITLEVYERTGNKKPCEGVSVREVTRLEYDPKEALKWAMTHQIALSLDKKSFEGFAKATPLEFVEIKTEAQATIAQDLTEVLK